jgi:hypothetical protein
MKDERMTLKYYSKALGLGIATSVILSLIMVPAFKAGLSPFPKPVALAFAQTLLGKVPLPVGLLFHLVYVTFWSVIYIVMFRHRTFLNALFLAFFLWIIVLIIFFPVIGWGFLGLAVSPKLIIASAVPHLLFAIILWGLCKLIFLNKSDI